MRRSRAAFLGLALLLVTSAAQAQEVDVVSYFGFKGHPRLIEEREEGVGGVWERTLSFTEDRLYYSRLSDPVDVEPYLPGVEMVAYTDRFEFDPAARTVTIWYGSVSAQVIHLDEQGRYASSRSFAVSATGGCAVRTVERTYTEDGSFASVLDKRTGCGDDFDTTETIYFDSEGRGFRREDFWIDGELDTVTEYTYDGMGEIIEVRSCEARSGECQGRRYEYAYDATGNWVSQVVYVLDAEEQQYVFVSTTTRAITYY